MCGIIGEIDLKGRPVESTRTEAGLARLLHRGPDYHTTSNLGTACFGHARLSILDISENSHQPMFDPSGRYCLVFNGEIYNYKELAKQVEAADITLKTSSDTEVLLHLLILQGKDALRLCNGFFAFCFYDKVARTALLARDRLGIKPLYYHQKDGRLQFASELKALLSYDIPKTLSGKALNLYFQLNYIPAPLSIIQGVKKLQPGTCIEVFNDNVTITPFYRIASTANSEISYLEAQAELRAKLQRSVQLRMISDVPLGSFLSGGIDSSVIATLAASGTKKLKTFSIGYADNPYFDETQYAELVAKKIGSDHTTFKLSNARILEQLPQVLSGMDEPFADSSAIAVNVLSELTRGHVTVALSGDGADEIFSGYNKHAAEWLIRNDKVKTALATGGRSVWRAMPHSRNSKWGNLFRKLDRFAQGAKLSAADRYWEWACFLQAQEAEALLHPDYHADYSAIKQDYTQDILGKADLTDVLEADCRLVLPNDMLTKVDKMSMAHALEVRTPFLDHDLVDFAFTLPGDYKINKTSRKRVLQDAFRDQLPPELYNRPKHGFEVPLRSWMTNELRAKIEGRYLNPDRVSEKRILSREATLNLSSRLFSTNPGNSGMTVWAIMVLDHWLEDLQT